MRLLLFLLVMALAASARGAETRQVTFTVTSLAPVADDETVCIAGSDPALGDWKADGLKLRRSPTDPDIWTGAVFLPADTAVEFKVTKGSWDHEQALDNNRVPGNTVIAAGGATNIAITVAHWKVPQAGKNLDLPPKITGDYRVHDNFHSVFLKPDRRVIVWLPPSYATDTERRYPVLYMHDGQQVFDPQTSTWNQDWEVDEACTRLIAEGKLQEIIVVANYCTEDRMAEYNPEEKGKDYARFLIEELKPFVDKTYRTLPDRNHTAVAGASMGGKISFYLAWAHPDVYFGAGCLSPAFIERFKTGELDMVRAATNAPDLKLYFYCGGGDELEKQLVVGQREMVNLLRQRGFAKNLMIEEDPAAPHNEAAWAKVTPHWLTFLFGTRE